MILIDWQASTTFRAYLSIQGCPQVSIRPALPKRFSSPTPGITIRQFSSRQSANRDGRSGCSAGSDPLSRLIDIINVHTHTGAIKYCRMGVTQVHPFTDLPVGVDEIFIARKHFAQQRIER
jgi:hypothetical protein